MTDGYSADLRIVEQMELKYGRTSFSQTGQDVLAAHLLRRHFGRGDEPGGFVDVGACWPVNMSNTYYFYKAGWAGVLIEPNPECCVMLRSVRPRDTVVEAGVASQNGRLTYYRGQSPTHNSFDPARGQALERRGRLLGTSQVAVERLDQILESQAEDFRRFDLLSVDAELRELDVVQSNDWGRFRPRLVIIESLDAELNRSLESELHAYMIDAGYALLAATGHDLFFGDARPDDSRAGPDGAG